MNPEKMIDYLLVQPDDFEELCWLLKSFIYGCGFSNIQKESLIQHVRYRFKNALTTLKHAHRLDDLMDTLISYKVPASLDISINWKGRMEANLDRTLRTKI
jgi:hypothetical protein